MPRPRRHNVALARGFTLLELLVVMVIIVIAAFAVRPTFSHALKADREHAALRRVISLLSSARTEAVARGRMVRIAIAPNQTTFQAELQAEPDYSQSAAQNTTDDYRTQFAPVALLGRTQVMLPDYLTLSDLVIGGAKGAADAEQAIYFHPDGRTSGAILRFVGATKKEYVVEVSPATGKVRIRV